MDETLLRGLIPAVLAILVRRGADFAAAEDAVQDALVEALRSWPEGSGATGAEPNGSHVHRCAAAEPQVFAEAEPFGSVLTDFEAKLLPGITHWQHPHFYAIAWIYKEDYRKAGFQMLSVVDARGHRLFLQVILYAFLLLAVSLMPTVLGSTGWIYLATATVLGVLCVVDSLRFVMDATIPSARRLLRTTIFYLPLLAVGVGLDVAWRF